MAESGLCSRRKAELLILNREISVNGKIVSELGIKVDPQKDEVCYKGERVSIKAGYIYMMLHKPVGYISSSHDQFNRETVVDLVKSETRVYPVGRLDYDSSGLILLTNDGGLAFKLTHPKHNIKKTYLAKLDGIPAKADIEKFEHGLLIDGYKTRPAKLKIINIKDGKAEVEIKIYEGRNRQIRKMCDKINCPVLTLKRAAIGELGLGGLQPGKYRYLTDDEVDYLKNMPDAHKN
ncbi:MAG: rRNA pseudouridine synthase [Clostridiales bacterium]|jgi:pseudouridine synthase|nr:rRNA pseudouridine synthase [Clostridiales bacterium]